MRNVVFDIETKNLFTDVGNSDPAALDISVVGVYDSATDAYSTYVEAEFPKLWPIIEQADALIGYNSNHFDIPLLNKYYHGDLARLKSIDLLHEIKQSLGRRIKLDTVAEATLGEGKSGHGLQAIGWWKRGEIDKVRAYCLDDVRLTKEIFDYALANKKLLYQDGGRVREIPIDTNGWEEKKEGSITHSLPF